MNLSAEPRELLPCRRTLLELVEKVENHGDVVCAIRSLRVRCLGQHEPLAVRVQVEAAAADTRVETRVGERMRLLGVK